MIQGSLYPWKIDIFKKNNNNNNLALFQEQCLTVYYIQTGLYTFTHIPKIRI